MAYARPPRGANGKYWAARWRDVDGNSAEESGFLDKESALNYAKDQEYLVRRGKKTKPSEMNLTVLEFIDTVWKFTLDVDEETAKDYEYGINGYILPTFGNKVMKEIKPADIEAWVASMNKVLAPRTSEKHRLLFASILKKAYENEYIHSTPFKGLKFSKAKKVNKTVALTFDQVTTIAESLSPRFRILIWICYYTAMRPSEALGLTMEQLDFENNLIHIDRQISRDLRFVHDPEGLKTDASERTIGFPKDLQKLIIDHIETHGPGPHGLILKTNGNKVLRYKGAIEMFRPIARKVGLKKGQGLHILRHTCVSILISEGATPKQIQEHVGHTSILDTMDTYGHLFPNAKHELSGMLDRYVAKQSETVKLEVAN